VKITVRLPGRHNAHVTPDDLREFFEASASVAGGLIGLLFVAISVAGERLRETSETQINRVRARASLGSFANALTVSLFALISNDRLGWTAFVVAILGITFVIASFLSLLRVQGMHLQNVGEIIFLFLLIATFVTQLAEGIALLQHPHDLGAAHTLATTVVVCFLIGIARAWELIGGPSIGIGSEIRQRIRDHPSADERAPR
jgi:hypothetical protein